MMIRRLLLLLAGPAALLVLLLWSGTGVPPVNAARPTGPPPPTRLYVVDVRLLERADPEIVQWLGSVQGTVNRQGGDTGVYLLTGPSDIMLLHELHLTYSFTEILVAPRDLLEHVRQYLTGQVLYDTTNAWKRNVAESVAAAWTGQVIALPATEADPLLPIVLDLRDKGPAMGDRLTAYAWVADYLMPQVTPPASPAGGTPALPLGGPAAPSLIPTLGAVETPALPSAAREDAGPPPAASTTEYALAPEGGHFFSDLIAAKRLVAVDYNPTNADEAAALATFAKRYTQGTLVYGNPDDRCVAVPSTSTTSSVTTNTHSAKDADAALGRLCDILKDASEVVVPLRYTPNLSCLGRFPIVRTMQQSRRYASFQDSDYFQLDKSAPAGNAAVFKKLVMVVYDTATPASSAREDAGPPANGGSSLSDDPRSVDYLMRHVYPLLMDSSLSSLPVAIQVPESAFTLASPLYQLVLSRQRVTSAELIAGPNGEGWARIPELHTVSPYYLRSEEDANAMDLQTLALRETGNHTAFSNILSGLQQYGWRGSILRPEEAQEPGGNFRRGQVLGSFISAVGTARVHNAADIHKALLNNQSILTILYADDAELPPSTLAGLRSDMESTHILVTPSQAWQLLTEYMAVNALYAQENTRTDIKTLTRGTAALKLDAPVVGSGGASPSLSADQPVKVSVKVSGMGTILLAQLLYMRKDNWPMSAFMSGDQVGAVELHTLGSSLLQGTLPPLLRGGDYQVQMRIVESGTCATTLSPITEFSVPVVDSDKDGADDTLELYQGTDPHNPDTVGDGLPDGFNPHPLTPYYAISSLMTVTPPTDNSFMTDTGTSKPGEDNGRDVPPGTSVTYLLPLQGIPAAPSALIVSTSGPGTMSLNGGAPFPLNQASGASAQSGVTLVPIPANRMVSRLQVKLSATDGALDIFSLGFSSNANGPYIVGPVTDPPNPPSQVPIAVAAMVFSPNKVKTVRLRYGGSTDGMASLPMATAAAKGGVIFTAEIPPQPDGSLMVLGIEAEDQQGNVSASPYSLIVIGRTRRHSLSLLPGRDLTGSWMSTPLYNGVGRSLTDMPGTDTTVQGVRVRPGRYNVWILAQPRSRGIAVNVKYNPLDGPVQTLLAKAVPGGATDGWYRLGDFSVNDGVLLDVNVSTFGDKGYCAYGEVVLTQDDGFLPPLPNGLVDWYNGVSILGLKEGQVITQRTTFQAPAIGNIDAVEVIVQPKSSTVVNPTPVTLTHDEDGFILDPHQFTAGSYTIYAVGYRLDIGPTGTQRYKLGSASVDVTIEWGLGTGD